MGIVDMKNIFAITLTVLLIVSCTHSFKEISHQEIRHEWNEAKKNSSVSWWYLGEQSGYHYIVVKSALKESKFKIKSKELVIKLDEPKEFSLDKEKWLNLKESHLSFSNNN